VFLLISISFFLRKNERFLLFIKTKNGGKRWRSKMLTMHGPKRWKHDFLSLLFKYLLKANLEFSSLFQMVYSQKMKNPYIRSYIHSLARVLLSCRIRNKISIISRLYITTNSNKCYVKTTTLCCLLISKEFFRGLKMDFIT